jgi:glycosyltransferase involved in cell wall biosynthesis
MPRWKRRMYLSIERLLSLRTARIIAVSPEESRAAIALGLGEQRVITIPNGVGDEPLAPRQTARRVIGAADEHEIVIGFVGRLVEQKAPDVLIRAFAQLVGSGRSVRLALVGDGPLAPAMRELACELGVDRQIAWLGERDARQLLAGCDVFAIASRKEGLPYVVLEAMMAGLPIVATSSAGVEILVKPGVNGQVVPPDDVAAFAAALDRLVRDHQHRLQCGQASKQLASRFTIDEMVDRTLDAYHAVLAERAPRDLTLLPKFAAR